MNIGSFIALTSGIGGTSNGSGFLINFRGHEYSTNNYVAAEPEKASKDDQKSPKEKRRGIPWLSWAVFTGILLGSEAVCFFVPAIRPTILWIMEKFFKAVFYFLMLALAVKSLALLGDFYSALKDYARSHPRPGRQYHACEHMAAALLSSEGVPATLENLRKMPRANLRCGTTILVIEISLLPCLFFFLTAFAISQGNPFAFSSPSGGLAAAGSLLVFCLTYWAGYGMLVILLSGLTQHFFATAKPSNRKLRKTLRLVWKIRRSQGPEVKG